MNVWILFRVVEAYDYLDNIYEHKTLVCVCSTKEIAEQEKEKLRDYRVKIEEVELL